MNNIRWTPIEKHDQEHKRTLIEECEQAHKDHQQKKPRLVTPPSASSLLFIESFIDQNVKSI